MLIGKSVFVYRNAEGFENPAPGIVTFAYADVEKLVDLEAFYRRSSQNNHAVPLERVLIVATAAEAREAFGRGVKFVAAPYDPTDPKTLEDKAEAPPAKTSKK